MTKLFLILTIFSFLNKPALSQSKMEIESLLSMLYQIDNSKDLSVNLQGKRLINYGNKILPILASKFLDTTSTNVKSMCQNFYLRKGEIAIIIADRIEYMPYAKLTQIQNCIATFCEDNPNFIEYYLSAIRKQGIFSFQKKYLRWLKAKKEENSHEKI